MVLRIGTLNCRGGCNKIDLIIDTINKSKLDILCLQEMHFVGALEKDKIERACEGHLYLNNGTTSSRGVATFIRDKEGLIATGIMKKDACGRYLNTMIKFEGEDWSVINAYAPNDSGQRSDFFIERNNELQNSFTRRRVYLGDFNNVLDKHLDRTLNETKGANKSDRSREILRESMKTNGMVDAYRKLFSCGINYTFTGSGGYRARLDRIYIDNVTSLQVTSVTTQAVPYSDHDLVMVTIGEYERQEKWGNGRWVLNKKLLFDKQTQDDIREMWLQWRERKMCFKSILDWWDQGKKLIADVYQINGKRIKRETERERNTLERELNSFLERRNIDKEGSDRIREIKNRLWELQKEKIEASKIRSKEKWLDEREKCSQYFYDQERKKGMLKSMTSLKVGEKIVKNKDEICEGAMRFYQQLYSKDDLDEDKMQTLIDRQIDKRLTDDQRDSIEGIVRKGELLESLKSMENDKSPGLDGLTREFYVMNWELIGSDYADVTANTYLQDRLPDSWSEGLITLIYKEKGDMTDLKNWRPITLLNTDYKIYTKALSDRFRKVTRHIINIDQGCGLGDRTIHDQLYYIRDYIDYYKQTNKRSMLLTIDQEKAFDLVHHQLLLKLLHKFNFGPTIIEQISIIYSKMKSRLIINGHITDSFDITRSVRQGDGLSMILFVIVAELLAQTIRHDIDLRPITLPNCKAKKLTQYADDTTIMTENHKCLKKLGKLLENYQRITGSKINNEKTEILLIGPWTKRERNQIPDEYKICIKESVKILGVWFGKNSKNLNEERLQRKIEEEIENWKNRNLSMKGKIAVIRTLVLSKMWHIAKVTGLQRKFIETVNKIIVAFFWHPKTFHCINAKVLQNSLKVGGLDFPNIDLELQAYFLETIVTAIKSPNKQWLGMMKYKLGNVLKNIDPAFRNRNQIIDTKEKQSTGIFRIIKEGITKIKDRVIDWRKLDHRKLKELLRENVLVTAADDCADSTSWSKLRRSSKNFKRLDLNYLIAHTRLPLAYFLSKINVTKDPKCRLCTNDLETQEHLFLECPCIQEHRNMVERDLETLTGSPSLLTYPLITMHRNVKSSDMNEIISIFKQCIWQVRGALFSKPGQVNIPGELKNLYMWKRRSVMEKK